MMMMTIIIMMRYNVIMRSSSGWGMIILTWLFCFCMGTIVYSVTNLIENHECTYVFAIAKVLTAVLHLRA